MTPLKSPLQKEEEEEEEEEEGEGEGKNEHRYSATHIPSCIRPSVHYSYDNDGYFVVVVSIRYLPQGTNNCKSFIPHMMSTASSLALEVSGHDRERVQFLFGKEDCDD